MTALPLLKVDLDHVCESIRSYDGMKVNGTLRFVGDGIVCDLPGAIGDQVRIFSEQDREIWGEVVSIVDGSSRIMPYEFAEHVRAGMPVELVSRARSVPAGDRGLGRILDGLGRPIDGRGPIPITEFRDALINPPSALDRSRIQEPFVTGQKAIDGLLTVGRGQRMGIFAGSGVGKSTLMGQIARGAESTVNVVALVGERGCELRPFIEDSLGPEGLQKSVVIVSTSDQLPLMRIRAVETAITIADHYREQGRNVLFFLDSLTRLAMARRELGLSLGEPPSARGYTPSVFQLMATTLERLGNGIRGSVTAFVTVLVDGDGLGEPVSGAARALLDGHIVLDRQIAERGHFPAINVLRSVSRSFLTITDAAHQAIARKIRQILATHAEVEDLIRIGAYTKGTNPQIDKVIELIPVVNEFLQQEVNQRFTSPDTRSVMEQISGAWPY